MRYTLFCLLLLLVVACPADAQTAPSPVATPGAQETPRVAATPGPQATPPVAATSGARVVPPDKSQPVTLPRFEKPPVIDGALNEDVWKQAAVFKDFYQTYPGDNVAPSLPTEVLAGYDGKFIYFAFRAHDEPGQVRATVAKRDEIFVDDNVGMYLDTFNDRRKAYKLYFNPVGVQADAIFTEGAGDDFSVDIVMESKGIVGNDGYTVEVAIPFKSLRYKAGKDSLWGVHFFRNLQRFNAEEASWMPINRDRSGLLIQAGHIAGLEGLTEERTLEIIPSLTVSETGKRIRTIPLSSFDENPSLLDPGRILNKPIQPEAGATAKFAFASNLVLTLAVNPDFAQVEADETVITANQRFPIFFAEKRPFFLEGIENFQTSLNGQVTAVHTRAIIDPDSAIKLTGKYGRNSFGILFASDNGPGNFTDEERENPAILPAIQRFIDKNAHVGIVRLKHDIGAESSIGLIATTHNFVDRHNQLGGFDGRFRIDPKTIFSFQVLGTNSRRVFFIPEQAANIYRTGNGLAYAFNLDRNSRYWGFNFSGQGRSKFYRALLGFTPRFNTNFQNLFVRYRSEPNPKARLISWNANNSFRPTYDWQGRLQLLANESQVNFNFPLQSFFTVGYAASYERLYEEEFGQTRTPTRRGTFIGEDSERSAPRQTIYFIAGTTPNKTLSLFLRTNFTGGAFDFDFGSPPRFARVSPAALLDPNALLDPGPGRALNIASTITYQPTTALNMTLNYTKSRLVRYDTKRVAFDENIFVLRSTYQFTRFTFARARVDFSSLASNIRGQFLLGWTPNPGTAFYVGYNDDLNRNGFNPFTGQFEPGFQRNGRTFFIKATYLIRRSF
jgi:hypothetical protein